VTGADLLGERNSASDASPRVINADLTGALLPMAELIDAVGRAFEQHPSPPERTLVSSPIADWLVMPGMQAEGGLMCKIARVDKMHNAATERRVSGTVASFSADGTLELLIDGPTLTARRTAAIAAYSTKHLARPEASVLAVFGRGALALPHVEALSIVRPLSEIRLVATSLERAGEFARRLRDEGWNARPATASEALAGADIVCTLTTSAVPIFADEDVQAGTHINAMGAYVPSAREIPSETVARAKVVVETRATAWREAGDLIQARNEGLITEDHVLADLTDGDEFKRLRRRKQDVTLFKSVGHVSLDIAATQLLLTHLVARERPTLR
jgi:ornithine cyclodeaminase